MITYDLYSKENRTYIFIIEGTVNIENEILNRRDAIGISENNTVKLTAEDDAKILFIEIPMN